MIITVQDEKELEDALNNWTFDGNPKVISKGQLYTLLNVVSIP